ncbi:MAG TPA: hypothetical protein VMU03_10870, partial [Gammaproteobacteria bacterium]|nr:hypothetical protein [Gammaproteobacteria bacterium]
LVALAALAQIRAATAAEKPSFKPPRTSWGDPDLQGVWDYRTITPVERRAEVGDREFYTDEEIAQLEGRAARRLDEAPDTSVQTNLVHADYLTDPGRHVDESRRTSLIVDPKNGRVPPLTPEGRERQEKAAAARAAAGAAPGGRVDSYRDRPLYERCITRGLPATILPTLYNNNIRISQSPGYVAIVHEMIHETRVVPLRGAFGHVRSYLGESRGHFEGDTLVVETRNFNGRAGYRGSGENLVLTERYTRVAPDKIDFRLTFDDRTQWTQPWTVEYFMRANEGELYEYACHEGNYGLRNILQEARDAEQAAATAAKH